MSGSTVIVCSAGRIGFHSEAQLLARTEGDDTACGDRDLFAGLGISTGTLVFGAQFEIAETGQFDLFASFQASADFFEKKIDELIGLALTSEERRVGKECVST